MEEELEKPKVIEDPKVKNIKRIKRYSLILLAIIIVSTAITGIYYLLGQEISLNPILTILPRNSLSSPTPTSVMLETRLILGRPQNTPILNVGSETLYQVDLINFLSIYYPQQLRESKISQEILDKAYESLTGDAIILQEGARQNLIKIDSIAFNNPQKTFRTRNILIEDATEKIKNKNITYTSGEIISMWFNNPSYPEPSIGVENAKKVVFEKMQLLRKDLVSGKINFEQAAQRIKNDTQQASIDPSYKYNAYAQFNKISKQDQLFTDQPVEDVWKFNKNQISEVILTKADRGNPDNVIEARFIIIKITDRVDSSFSNFDQWLNETKKNYTINNLI